MEQFVKGDIVVTPFPFSDLSSTIKRPALVAANLKGDDVILCQITTKQRPDPHNLTLTQNNLQSGNLKINSFIRPSRLFTFRKSIISYKLGKLKNQKIQQVENELIKIFKR